MEQIYDMIIIGGGARFMFSWDADPARVEALAADMEAVFAD